MFYAQQMQLQNFDAVKSRLGLTQVQSVNQGPRHTIDAILGLNGQRQRVSEFEARREGERDRDSEAVSVSPGAVESAGKFQSKLRIFLWFICRRVLVWVEVR